MSDHYVVADSDEIFICELSTADHPAAPPPGQWRDQTSFVDWLEENAFKSHQRYWKTPTLFRPSAPVADEIWRAGLEQSATFAEEIDAKLKTGSLTLLLFNRKQLISRIIFLFKYGAAPGPINNLFFPFLYYTVISFTFLLSLIGRQGHNCAVTVGAILIGKLSSTTSTYNLIDKKFSRYTSFFIGVSRRLVTTEANEVSTKKIKAQLLFKLGRLDSAKVFIIKHLKQKPNDHEAYLIWNEISIGRHDLDAEKISRYHLVRTMSQAKKVKAERRGRKKPLLYWLFLACLELARFSATLSGFTKLLAAQDKKFR